MLGKNVYVVFCICLELFVIVVFGILIEKEVYIVFICSLCLKDIDISIEY